MKKLFECILPMALMFGICCSIFASPEVAGKKKKKEANVDVGTTITLVTSGTGDTKEEAVKNALRSALEQTYGAFVSSNSQIVNDELVKDEIVSISTGNIVSYEELSFIDSNPKQVSVSAVVSITRLQNYAQNKGMSAELAGNTFAMNLKMEEINKKNQDVALKHLLEQTKLMSENLFDYELSVGDPEKSKDEVHVPVTIRIKANNNTVSYYEYFHKTLTSLAVEKKTGSRPYLYGKQGIEIDGFKQFDGNAIAYVLRGEVSDPEPEGTLQDVLLTLNDAILNCELVDNLGNIASFFHGPNEKGEYVGLVLGYPGRWGYYASDRFGPGMVRPYRDGYDISSGWYKAVYKNFHWMNAVRPKVGEKLFKTELFLKYTVDEISKVSKIEVRPKKTQSQQVPEEIFNITRKAFDLYQQADKISDKSEAIEKYKQALNLLDTPALANYDVQNFQKAVDYLKELITRAINRRQN